MKFFLGTELKDEKLGGIISEALAIQKEEDIMIPPRHDWKCKNCGESGKVSDLTSVGQYEVEIKGESHCPKCGKNIKVFSLIKK